MKEAIKRLEELLYIKDDEIARLQDIVNEHNEKQEQEEDRDAWKWTVHRKITDSENLNLPVPRLELRYKSIAPNHYISEWDYGLAYRHLLGDIIFVPLGRTRVTGGQRAPICKGKIDLPFRDGAHIKNESEQLNLPAYAICEGVVQEIKTKEAPAHEK